MAIFGGIMSAYNYTQYAKNLDALIAGKNKIAAWTCQHQIWTNYIGKNVKNNTRQRNIIYAISGGLSALSLILLALGYYLKFDEDSIFIILIFNAFFLFFFLLFIFIYAFPDPHEGSKKGRILIGTNAVYIEGKYTEWQPKDANTGNLLQELIYNKEQQTLLFRISVPEKRSRSIRDISLPIPPNEEDNLAIVLAYFKDYI